MKISTHVWRRCCGGLVLLVLAAGCALLGPTEQDGQSTLNDFMYTLRWQQYPAAARYLAAEHRQSFYDRFSGLKGLNVTDVRLLAVTFSAEGRKAETTMEMDYYLLPSATLKTFRFQQTWVYFDAPGFERSGFLATTPFPPFP